MGGKNAARRRNNWGGRRNDRNRFVVCKICDESSKVKQPDWIWFSKCYVGMPDYCKTCKAQGQHNTWDVLAAKVGLTPPESPKEGGGNNRGAVNANGESPAPTDTSKFLDHILGKPVESANAADEQALSHEDLDEILRSVHQIMQDASILQPISASDALKQAREAVAKKKADAKSIATPFLGIEFQRNKSEPKGTTV